MELPDMFESACIISLLCTVMVKSERQVAYASAE